MYKILYYTILLLHVDHNTLDTVNVGTNLIFILVLYKFFLCEKNRKNTEVKPSFLYLFFLYKINTRPLFLKEHSFYYFSSKQRIVYRLKRYQREIKERSKRDHFTDNAITSPITDLQINDLGGQ